MINILAQHWKNKGKYNKAKITEIVQNNNTSNITISDINIFRKNVYEKRRNTMPQNPTNLVDVHAVIKLINVKTK